MFAFGASSEDSEDILVQQKRFVSMFIDSFELPIANKLVKLGLIEFFNSGSIVKNLHDNYTISHARTYLNNINVLHTGEAIAHSLNMVADKSFYFSHPGSLKFLVLFADNLIESDKLLLEEAKSKLKQLGVCIVLISATNKINLADVNFLISDSRNVITNLSTKDFFLSFTRLMDILIKGMLLHFFAFAVCCIYSSLFIII